MRIWWFGVKGNLQVRDDKVTALFCICSSLAFRDLFISLLNMLCFRSVRVSCIKVNMFYIRHDTNPHLKCDALSRLWRSENREVLMISSCFTSPYNSTRPLAYSCKSKHTTSHSRSVQLETIFWSASHPDLACGHSFFHSKQQPAKSNGRICKGMPKKNVWRYLRAALWSRLSVWTLLYWHMEKDVDHHRHRGSY